MTTSITRSGATLRVSCGRSLWSRVSKRPTPLANQNAKRLGGARHLALFTRRNVTPAVRSAAKEVGAQVITFAELVRDLDRLPEHPDPETCKSFRADRFELGTIWEVGLDRHSQFHEEENKSIWGNFALIFRAVSQYRRLSLLLVCSLPGEDKSPIMVTASRRNPRGHDS
jgi:hypothetical protein